MNSLRIALVSRRYWPQVGGVEVTTARLATEFRRLGHQPRVLTAQWESSWPTEVVHHEFPVTRLVQPQIRGWGTIRYLHALSRWLRKHVSELDAVVVSTLRHDVYAAIATLRNTPVPVIVRAAGAGATSDVAWQREARFGGRVQRACLTADAIIAPSAGLEDELLLAGYPRARTHLVPSGVELVPLRQVADRGAARRAVADANLSLEMVPDAPLVVFTGRLEEQKGLADLVAAWDLFSRKQPNARAWMIGDGPFRETLYELIVDRGLHHQMFLPGAFDDVAGVLTAADLFVQPAHAAGSSLALLEAMAAGVPIIATDIPAHRELLAHEEHALLVPPHDPPALVAAIERLLVDERLAERLVTAARARVEARHSIEQAADRYLEIIEHAMRAKRK